MYPIYNFSNLKIPAAYHSVATYKQRYVLIKMWWLEVSAPLEYYELQLMQRKDEELKNVLWNVVSAPQPSPQ